jgi:hypothetical protein
MDGDDVSGDGDGFEVVGLGEGMSDGLVVVGDKDGIFDGVLVVGLSDGPKFGASEGS